MTASRLVGTFPEFVRFQEEAVRLAPIPCPHCKAPFERGLLDARLRECLSFPVECVMGCGAKGLVRGTAAAHAEKECPKALVACPYGRYGCPHGEDMMERHCLRVHLAEAVQEHLSLAIQHLVLRVHSLEDANHTLEASKADLVQRCQSLEETNRRQSSLLQGHVERLEAANALLTRRLDELAAKEKARTEREQRTAEEAFLRDPCWDVNDTDRQLVLSNRNKTVSLDSSDSHHSLLGAVGFSAGIHRWKIRIDALHWGVVVGVHPKPRPGGGDYWKTGYGASVDEGVSYGPPRGWVKDETGIQMSVGDVVSVELNCDAHTLTVSNPACKNGRTSVMIHVPPDRPLFPWGSLGQRTCMTIMPF